MDNFIEDIAKMMAETTLQAFLWKDIRKDWWEAFPHDQLFIDDIETVLAVKNDGSVALLEYIHFDVDTHKRPNYQNVVISHIIDRIKHLKEMAVKNNWGNDGKVIIVTTYKLSNYQDLDTNQLPVDANYFYMTEMPDTEDRKYNMQLDQGIVDRRTDDMLKYFFKRGKDFTSEP